MECLNETGRPWEVVIAGRQLPQLARLHGYGFEVDLQAVRKADLSAKENDDTLHSCIHARKLVRHNHNPRPPGAPYLCGPSSNKRRLRRQTVAHQ